MNSKYQTLRGANFGLNRSSQSIESIGRIWQIHTSDKNKELIAHIRKLIYLKCIG